MVAGETVVLAYSIIAFIFAYLAMNLSDEHGPFRLLNLLMVYLTIFFTGFLAISVLSGGDASGLVAVFNNAFSWIFYIVVAYFMIHVLYQLFMEWKEEASY